MLSRRPLNNKVGLVEDDDALAGEIGLALAAEALSVQRFSSAEALLDPRIALSAILLDRMIDGRDSIHMLERLRVVDNSTPVIIISGLTSIEERVDGLKAGADDYIIKPFAMVELLARLGAARRRSSIEETRLVAGPLILDRLSRILYRNSEPIKLLPKEYDLLEYFMINEGLILTRSMLLEKIWKVRLQSETNVVDVSVGNLRKKIEVGDNRLIQSVRGQGFRFGDASSHARI